MITQEKPKLKISIDRVLRRDLSFGHKKLTIIIDRLKKRGYSHDQILIAIGKVLKSEEWKIRLKKK